MKQRIESALPGFLGVREFFRRLGTSFESVPLETVDIDRFRKGILAIRGNPRDYLETSVWAWFATARAREMRRYSDGTWLVRFGSGRFAMIFPCPKANGSWPSRLMRTEA